MRLSGELQASLFFFNEKILSLQKTSKRKITYFPPLWSFLCKKLLPLLFFVRLFVVLLVGFGWFTFLYAQNLLVKKKINWLKSVLIASYTILLLLSFSHITYWNLANLSVCVSPNLSIEVLWVLLGNDVFVFTPLGHYLLTLFSCP